MRAKIPTCGAWVTVAFLVAALGLLPTPVYATSIGPSDIVAIPQHVTGSGHGHLDLRMFTFSGSEIQNTFGSFNGDNGNNTLPQGGGADTNFFDESYVTTAGELKAYFNLNFAPGSINDIMLLLDLNETGDGQPNNTLAKLDVILNPTSIQGNPDPFGDVSSDEQAAINQVYSGGTMIAWLDPQPAANLPVNSQGAGFADYAILTGIDPFALNDSDVLLFNISMNTLNNGAEDIFLSGTYSEHDIQSVPEPLTMVGVGMSIAGLAGYVRRRVRK